MYVFTSVLLTSLLVPIILRFIVCKIQSSKSSPQYIFKYPIFIPILLLIGIITIILLFIWAYLSDYEASLALYVFLYSFYFLFTIAGAWQFWKTLNFQLILEEDFLLYRNFLGKVKQIKYEEISKIKTYNGKSNNPIQYRIYIGNKKIDVDNFTTNFNDFPNIMKKRLKKAKNTIHFT